MSGERKFLLRYKFDEGLVVAYMAAANRYQWSKIGVWKFVLALFIVGFLLGAATSKLDHLLDGIRNEVFLPSNVTIKVFFGLLAVLIGIRWMRRKMARFLLNTPSFRGDVQMTLDHLGVDFRTGVSHSFFQWAGVDDVLETAKGLALRIGGHTIPLPDTALPEACDRSSFKDQISEWRKAAQ